MKCILLLTFVAFCHSYSYSPLSGSVYGSYGKEGIGYGSYGKYIPQVYPDTEVPYFGAGIKTGSYYGSSYPGPYAAGAYPGSYAASSYPSGIYDVLNTYAKQSVYYPYNLSPYAASAYPGSYPASSYLGPYAASSYPSGTYDILNSYGQQSVYYPYNKLYQYPYDVVEGVPELPAVFPEGEYLPQGQSQSFSYPWLKYWQYLSPALKSYILKVGGGYPYYYPQGSVYSGYGYGQSISPYVQPYGGIPVPAL